MDTVSFTDNVCFFQLADGQGLVPHRAGTCWQEKEESMGRWAILLLVFLGVMERVSSSHYWSGQDELDRGGEAVVQGDLTHNSLSHHF